MKQWWRQRQPRERQRLQLGGIILLAAGLYLALIRPAQRAIDRAERHAATAQQQAQTVASLAKALNDLGGAPRRRANHGSGDSEPTLFAQIDALVRRGPLRTSITRVQPQGNDRVQLQLQRARFDLLIAQLQRIETQTGSRLDHLTLRREASAGTVSGIAQFRAAPAPGQ